jgi:hypothetical protein
MDFSRIREITISHLDFDDLIAKRTGNPIAEGEVPDMLKRAIADGARVILTDPFGSNSCQLKLNGDGQFHYGPVEPSK